MFGGGGIFLIAMTDTISQIRAPRRARSTLNSLINNRMITAEGMNWLVQATDPFHDTEIPPTGFPDPDTSRSLVQTYVYTQQLVAPSGLATPTWDAHVFFLPLSPIQSATIANDVYTRATINARGVIAPLNNNIFLVSGYNALSVPAGYDWVNGPLATPGVNTSLQFPRTGSTGQYRLVACGFEVVNTSAELYRGGSVTVFRTPTSNTTRQIYFGIGSYTAQQVTTLPASTQAEAQLYPSSRTWGAEDGCYVVGTLNGAENSYITSQPSNAAATVQMTSNELQNIANSVITFIPGSSFVTNQFMEPCNQILPFDSHGAIFTGLLPQATLQVTVRYYIERIPTSRNPDLLVLTRPPTPFDPVALEIYSRALSALPVGVKVSENPLGEWFNEVMDMVSSWAPKIGNALGNVIPGASALGNALGAASGAAAGINRATMPTQPKKRQRKKKKKSAPPADTRVTNQTRKKA